MTGIDTINTRIQNKGRVSLDMNILLFLAVFVVLTSSFFHISKPSKGNSDCKKTVANLYLFYIHDPLQVINYRSLSMLSFCD